MIEAQTPTLPDSAPSRVEPAGVSFAWLLAVLLIHRRFILVVAGFGLMLSVVGAFLTVPKYTSSFSFSPQTSQDPSRAGLASLAGQLGISVGGASEAPQLYAELVSTRDVLSPIARDSFALAPGDGKRVPLATFLGIRGADPQVVEERTLRNLRTRIVAASAATRTSGVVSVTVRTKSAEVSFEIAERLLDGLNQFNLATRKSQAGEERRFTEGRLAAAKVALRAAEDSLQNFLFANRQFGNSPQLTFQRERLQREVSLRQQVVLGLAQQYEDARIREVRDTPVITVIEKPALPAMADPRGRGVIIVLGTFLALLLGIGLVLVWEGWNRQRRAESADPSYSVLASEWNSLRRPFQKP
ncbi:MAG TPA: hypothetical protein VHE78_14670 [Gemmatimonadaceae bacterium]|nr:hypothetical protein [Gemmatimonadaceae bacterium]